MNTESADIIELDETKEIIKNILNTDELELLNNFFADKNFSFRGKIELLKIVLTAKMNNKPIIVLIESCCEEWDKIWKFQYHCVRANMNYRPIQLMNILAFENICKAVGIPIPVFNVSDTLQLGE